MIFPIISDHYLLIKKNRYQKKLTMVDIFPLRTDGLCACGCGKKLKGKQRRWASKKCIKTSLTYFHILKGDVKTIRIELIKKFGPICNNCKIENLNNSEWDADHILEVRHGGRYCGLENFQILCKLCHKEKTKNNYR